MENDVTGLDGSFTHKKQKESTGVRFQVCPSGGDNDGCVLLYCLFSSVIRGKAITVE